MKRDSWIFRMFEVFPEIKGSLFVGSAYTLALEAFKLAPPYFMKSIVDLLVAPPVSFPMLLSLCLGILFVSLLVTVIEDRYNLSTAMSIFTLESGILRKAHAKLLELDLRYHEGHPSGELVQLLSKGATKLGELMWYTRDQFLGALFQIVLTSLLLMAVNLWCGVVFIAFMPVVLVLVYRSSKRVQPYRRRYHRMFRRATWEMNQSIINVRTVKDFSQEEKERYKFNTLLDRYLELAELRIRTENSDIRNRDIVLGMARFAVLFYAVYLVYCGEMSAGTLLLFATLSEKVISSLYRLGRLYSFLGDSMESITQFSELFAEEPGVRNAENATPCPSLSGAFSLKNVGFSYTSGVPVLSHINLEIPARKTVALVGRSGSGKTTVIKLLGRHYDVTEGSISADGIDIRKYDLSEYRRQIAVVSQDVEVFDTSVRDNIAYGITISQDEVERAAKAAHAHEFIVRLPRGYDTRIGERGLKLSGGQRQRIGIARALAVRPAILVFDEATASLDTESEREIQEALRQLANEHTMVVIAHRLSTIESADLVVVFDQGKIVECGPPQQLIDQPGLFAYMRQLQNLGELRQ